MTKVITYGTYDLLHFGHIKLLERAKALGDYLIVGVTADDFDKSRGKINVQQSLMERVEAVRATGLADEIIIEEYEGQKIDDIKRHDVDIFTVGSDWKGKFDYLNEYCKVVYLERTEGISSSELRSELKTIRLGLIGDTDVLIKYYRESQYVNGIAITGAYTRDERIRERISCECDNCEIYMDMQKLMEDSDAIYIASHPRHHFDDIKLALSNKKHVLCESPVVLDKDECEMLFELADKNGVKLMEANKTAYSTAYSRLLLILKTGIIGKVRAIDVTCTSLSDMNVKHGEYYRSLNSMEAWGPTGLLPVFQILGTEYKDITMNSLFADDEQKFDGFTKIDLVYDDAIASIKVGKAVKSEGELVISGSDAYIYVAAPWWLTDYFEVRYENPQDNKRYFYQLDGEGIRYLLLNFTKTIQSGKDFSYISKDISVAISDMMQKFNEKQNLNILKK